MRQLSILIVVIRLLYVNRNLGSFEDSICRAESEPWIMHSQAETEDWRQYWFYFASFSTSSLSSPSESWASAMVIVIGGLTRRTLPARGPRKWMPSPPGRPR